MSTRRTAPSRAPANPSNLDHVLRTGLAHQPTGAPTGDRLTMDQALIRHAKLLIHAAERGNLEEVRDLLNRGAEVDNRNRNGHTALHQASSMGFLEIVKLLLRSGASVDLPDGDGETALMMAAYRGKADVVRLLLINGADPNRGDNNGTTPVQMTRDENIKRIFREWEEAYESAPRRLVTPVFYENMNRLRLS